MTSFFLAIQGPTNTVVTPGFFVRTYRSTATMGDTVVETKAISSGKCLRTMLTKAGQQEEVVALPAALFSRSSPPH